MAASIDSIAPPPNDGIGGAPGNEEAAARVGLAFVDPCKLDHGLLGAGGGAGE